MRQTFPLHVCVCFFCFVIVYTVIVFEPAEPEPKDDVILHCTYGVHAKGITSVTWYWQTPRQKRNDDGSVLYNRDGGVVYVTDKIFTLNSSTYVEERYKGRVEYLKDEATSSSRAIRILNIDSNFISERYWCELTPNDVQGFIWREKPLKVQGLKV